MLIAQPGTEKSGSIFRSGSELSRMTFWDGVALGAGGFTLISWSLKQATRILEKRLRVIQHELKVGKRFTPCHVEQGNTNPVPVHPEGLCASCDSIYAWRRRGMVEQEIRQGFERRGA